MLSVPEPLLVHLRRARRSRGPALRRTARPGRPGRHGRGVEVPLPALLCRDVREDAGALSG
ncbi:MAG: hypothetical protein WKF47_12060 [Geodermatophilaceae bacterium]